MNECMLKALIIDDEQFCINNIDLALKSYPEIKIIGCATNTVNAKQLILKEKPDLLFLDVELSQESGLEMLNALSERINWQMQIVFCTAYEKYLLNALRSGAFDFLLKPFSQSEFDEVMQRYFKKIHSSQPNFSTRDLFNTDVLKKQFLFVNTALGIEKFEIDKIVYFEYEKSCRTWHATDVNQKSIALKHGTTASDILNINDCLWQANQYQIINSGYVASITFDNKCKLVPPFNEEFCISRRYQKDFYNRISML